MVHYEKRDGYVRVISNRGSPEKDYKVKLKGEKYIVSASTRRVAVNRAMKAYEEVKGRDIVSVMGVIVKEVSFAE